MNTPISVIVPVGPNPAYLQWLPECFDSILKQTYLPQEIILIDDWANLYEHGTHKYPFMPGNHLIEQTPTLLGHQWYNKELNIQYRIWKPPWNVGVADAFNFGVALSETNLVFLIGSDDRMMPTCLEECVAEYEIQKIEGWYNVTIETSSGDIQWIPNNTAMVTKRLWEWTGGFPPSAGVGGPDALLLSILMVHAPERIIQVKQDTPLCWLREHEHQATKHDAAHFVDEVISIRNKETLRWTPRC